MTFFYNLNKKLDEIRATPSTTHGQLNERDMSRAAKGYEKYGKEGMEALAKAGREGKDLDKVRAKYDKYDDKVDEGMDQLVQRIGGIARQAKKIGGNVLNKVGHGDDAEMMRDLQKKMGLPQTGLKPGDEPNPKIVKEKMSPAKAKNFAALAEPKDKITFADKIAGAKKEVDEMLGDVAAEAMKAALSPKQKKIDMNKNGKLDANDFAMLRKGGKQETDEGWDDMLKDVEKRRGQMKTGEKVAGHKGEIEKTSTGIKHTRSYDAKTGETDSDDQPAGEKRGRGRPKGTGGPRQERATAKSRKTDRTAHGQSGFKKAKAVDEGGFDPEKVGMGGGAGDITREGADEGSDLVKLSKVIASCQTKEQLETARKMAQNFLSKYASGEIGFAGGKLRQDIGRRNDVVSTIKQKNKELGGNTELDEKAVSKKQQKFMGMVHATQKGEKAPSKEVAKVAKTMKKSDAEDFASTKHKGLPEKKKPEGKKKEKTEEAGGSGTPTASSGFSFGQGIYDSFNRDLESMISESMSVNMSDSTEGGKSLTITASDEDAIKLATLLKSAGLGGDEGYGGTGYKSACGCGTPDCSCGDEAVDEAYGDTQPTENQPNWPTNQETAQDNFEYSGGLNKPKSTGQTTAPVIASQDERQGTYAEAEEDAIKRMMEMAGIKEGKKPDFLDVDKDGDKKEPFKKAVDDKKEKKVDEGILSATANLWSEYKGKYGV